MSRFRHTSRCPGSCIRAAQRSDSRGVGAAPRPTAGTGALACWRCAPPSSDRSCSPRRGATVLTACSSPRPGVPRGVGRERGPRPGERRRRSARAGRFYTRSSAGARAPPSRGPDDPRRLRRRALDCARLRSRWTTPHPQGPTAQLGVLRQKATGDKIGSLLFDPGGPGAPGMRGAVAVGSGRRSPTARSRSASTWSASTRAASAPAVPPSTAWTTPRGGRARRPLRRPVAGRRAGRGGEPRSTRTAARTDRRGHAGLHGHPRGRHGHRRPALRRRRREAQLPRLLLRHAARHRLRRGVPAARAGARAGRRDRPDPVHDRPSVQQAAGFQHAFDNFAKDCAKQAELPARHRPGAGHRAVPGDHAAADRPAGRRSATAGR